MGSFVLEYRDLTLTVKRYRASRCIRAIVRRDGVVTLTCHTLTSKKDIEKFIKINYAWIVEALKKNVSLQSEKDAFSGCDVEELKRKAEAYVPERILYLAKLNGLQFKEISIGKARTKWGSCSRDGRIRISCYVMILREELIDYVLLHELCHLVHFNHSAAFHKKLEAMLPSHNEKLLVDEIKKISIQK